MPLFYPFTLRLLHESHFSIQPLRHGIFRVDFEENHLAGHACFVLDYVQRCLDQLLPYSRLPRTGVHPHSNKQIPIDLVARHGIPNAGYERKHARHGPQHAWVQHRQRSEPLFMAILSRVGASTPGGERGTPIGVDALAPLLLRVLRRLFEC